MKNENLNKFEKSLMEIIRKGVIDHKIFDNIEELKKSLNISKDKWLEIDDKNIFYFYNAIFNIEIILGEIKNKLYNNFETTQKTSVISKDNPEIAMKSLVLLPTIDEIFKIIELYKIDKKLIESILNKTQDLRKMTINTFLPESLDVGEYCSDENLIPEFNQLLTNLIGVKN